MPASYGQTKLTPWYVERFIDVVYVWLSTIVAILKESLL